MKPVVLLILATATELETCRAFLERHHRDKSHARAGKFIYETEELLILIEKLPAMGTLEAGVCVAQLVRQYHPLFVVGIGICAAAAQPEPNAPCPCDLMIATHVVYYEPTKQWPSHAEWRPRLFSVLFPPEIISTLVPITKYAQTLCPQGATPMIGKRHSGAFACGERVLADENAIDVLQGVAWRKFGIQLTAMDMESAGIARGCEHSGTPFVIAKAVSDFGTVTKDDLWQRAAAALSIDSVLTWLEKLDRVEIDLIRPRISTGHDTGRLDKGTKAVRLAGYMVPTFGVSEDEVYDDAVDDLASITDYAIGTFMENQLAEPTVQVYVEEKLSAQGGRPWATGDCWVIDPVDGTQNLVAGRSEVAISAAFLSNGKPKLGIIGMPHRHLVVSATAGGRLELNDHRWSRRSSGATRLAEAVVALPGDLRRLRHGNRLFDFAALVGRVAGIRITGALAYDLACLALGEFDARVSTSAKLVDVAAGALLVQQTGGVVTDLNGDPWTLDSDTILAARTHELHRELLECLRDSGLGSPASPHSA